MDIERCNFCSTTKETKDLKRCSNCRQVFCLSGYRSTYTSYLAVSGSPSTASIPPARPFQVQLLTFHVQSKECQTLHWKTGHKAACVPQTQLSRDPGEDPNGKAQVKKVNRWINAWSLAITICLPTALDLVNHQWGRHETHTYVHRPTFKISF